MKRELKQLSWIVKNFNCNAQKIEDYDVLKYREEQIKKLKKQSATKEEFAKKLRSEFQWQYLSRSEYEVVIEIDSNNRIWLNPWVGCHNPETVRIDVTDDQSFDWQSFANEHIGKQIYKNRAKIDIFDQLTFANRFEKLVDYCWYTRLKYERYNPKFDR